MQKLNELFNDWAFAVALIGIGGIAKLGLDLITGKSADKRHDADIADLRKMHSDLHNESNQRLHALEKQAAESAVHREAQSKTLESLDKKMDLLINKMIGSND